MITLIKSIETPIGAIELFEEDVSVIKKKTAYVKVRYAVKARGLLLKSSEKIFSNYNVADRWFEDIVDLYV